MKDSKPVLLLLLAIGLVSTWVYHLYDKAQYTRQATAGADSRDVSAIQDSLSRLYSDSLRELNSLLANARTDADSLQVKLDTKLAEIDKLKSDILLILNKPVISKKDLALAREKVAELQQKIGELDSANSLIGEEKSQLNIKVQQLTQNADSLVLHIRQLSSENQALSSKVSESSIFTAFDVKLSAVELKAGAEEETNQAKKADKFVVSFLVQNAFSTFNNAEVAIVVIQPDQQVLQNTKWDSGNFDTRMEGRKSYTRLVKFDYDQGDRRALIFSLESERFLKGSYILQLWHKGVMIGQAGLKLH
ncbi:MAG TPA: hypothetical protein VK644_14035 [Chitinophagaceae bacterium]|nr:hypothetical protein [Chitinophagaceae bacterium]